MSIKPTAYAYVRRLCHIIYSNTQAHTRTQTVLTLWRRFRHRHAVKKSISAFRLRWFNKTQFGPVKLALELLWLIWRLITNCIKLWTLSYFLNAKITVKITARRAYVSLRLRFWMTHCHSRPDVLTPKCIKNASNLSISKTIVVPPIVKILCFANFNEIANIKKHTFINCA